MHYAYNQEIQQSQTNSRHREEEIQNTKSQSTVGRQFKQSNPLALPHQDDCKMRKDIK